MMRLAFLFLTASWLSGCAYNVPAINIAATNVYSTYDTKVPGTFALVLDDSVTNVSRQVKASGHVCSAHTYPIAIGDSIGVSVRKLMESQFDEVVVRTTMPSAD